MWIWLHGLFGDDLDWRPVTDQLTELQHVSIVLPGHRSRPVQGAEGGPERRRRSGAARQAAGAHLMAPAADFDDLVRATRQRIAATLADHQTDAWYLAGYSLGGRVALAIALDRDPALPPPTALVLEGASPGIDDEDARAQRRALDDERAVAIERDGLEPFLEQWYRQPLFAVTDDDARCALVEERRHQDPAAMAAMIRLASPGRVRSRWADVPRLDIPCLYLAGSRDEVYTATARRFADACPNAHARVVPDAGHNAHRDNPQAVADTIRQLFGRAERPPAPMGTR